MLHLKELFCTKSKFSYRRFCIGEAHINKLVTVAPVIDGAGHCDGLIILVQTGHTVQPRDKRVGVKIKELLDEVLSLVKDMN